MLSHLPDPEKALTFHQSLTGRAEIASANIPDEELEEDGVNKILEKLDPIFMPDIWQRQFYNFLELHRLQKKEGVNMHDFICDFDQKYYKFQQVNGEMADSVLAFMLLSACQMSHEHTQLVKAGVGKEISYANMKETLKRIFGDEHILRASPNPGISSEDNELLYCEDSQKDYENEVLYGLGRLRLYRERGGPSSRVHNHTTRGSSRGRFRGRYPRGGYPRGGPSSRGGFKGYKPIVNYRGKRINPLNSQGIPTTCRHCKSILHYIAQCPELKAQSSDKDNDVLYNFSWFVGCMSGEVDSKLDGLVSETKGFAVLDSGCPNTVCGEKWMKTYIGSILIIERIVNDTTTTGGNGTEL